MEPKSAAVTPLTLELVDDVPPAVRVAPVPIADLPLPAPPPPPVAPPAVDRFLAQATRERDSGLVDQALWSRSLALANGDEAAALPPYLRARAAMLKLAASRAPAPAVALQGAIATGDDEDEPPPTRRARPKALLFAGAGVAILALAVGAWLVLAPAEAPVAAPSALAKPVAVADDTSKPEAPVDPGPELAARVAALKQQGNWNVLVLHAAEWTRRKPNDAAAWAELANGYLRLKQVDEAFEAAKRAAALDATAVEPQRLLAAVYLALDRPADALPAIERAIELDPGHADGFAQLGAVNVRLGKLAEARGAYERALALDPVHTAASCGVLELSRAQGRAKDAEALARAMQAAQIACPEPVTVATSATANAGARSVPVKR